jgi:hypothetical protein
MTDTDRERRRRVLYAALGFCQLQDSPDMPEVRALKRWLSTWTGIGHIVIGMERQGYAVRLSPVLAVSAPVDSRNLARRPS